VGWVVADECYWANATGRMLLALYTKERRGLLWAATQAYLAGVLATNGTTVVMGFCWGGLQPFRYATMADDLAAAMVFHGFPPEEGFDASRAPIYGSHGERPSR